MKSYAGPFFELDVNESVRNSGALSVINDLDFDNLFQNLIFLDICVRTLKQVILFLFEPYIDSKGALARY